MSEVKGEYVTTQTQTKTLPQIIDETLLRVARGETTQDDAAFLRAVIPCNGNCPANGWMGVG